MSLIVETIWRPGMRCAALAMVLILLAACSQPNVRDLVIPTDPARYPAFLARTKSLGVDDIELLEAYLQRVEPGPSPMPPGTTVGQAIDAERRWEKR